VFFRSILNGSYEECLFFTLLSIGIVAACCLGAG